MATPSELRQVETILSDLSGKAHLCDSLADALIQTGESWVSSNGFLRLCMPTDFERGRAEVIHACRRAIGTVQKVRSDTLSPHLIHTQHHLAQMLNRCEQCPAQNRERREKGQPFVCLLREGYGDKQQGPFRFHLNEKGQIVEQG